MTKLKQPVKKICEYCGKEFEAGKTTTRCCSDYCSKRAYKDAKRKKVVAAVENSTMQKKAEKIEKDLSNRQGYSIAEVAVLLGKCKQTVYNLAHSGKIKAIRISSKFTIIQQKSIDDFLEVTTPYEVLQMPERKPVVDWYALKEVTEKYGFKYQRLRDIINLSEWLTLSELKEQYSMTKMRLTLSFRRIVFRRNNRTANVIILNFTLTQSKIKHNDTKKKIGQSKGYITLQTA